MTDMFEKAYKEFDNIKPSAKAVNRAVESAVNAVDSSAEKKVCKFSERKIITVAMAACLVLVFVGTLVLGLQKNIPDIATTEDEYSFSIKANAAQAALLGENPDSSVIGAYSSEMSGGWAMYDNLEKDSGDSPSFYQSYCLNYLNIEGEGIKSVTFKANAEGTYFAISPDGYYKTTGNTNSISNTETEKFTDLSLNNSIYSSKELSRHKDGLSYGEIYCDTFTYLNTDNNDDVNLNCKVEYVIESSHSNSKNTNLLNKIWLYEEEIIKEKESGIPSVENLNKLYIDMSETSEELQKLALKDATVDVTVTFADGSEQTKRLKMGLTQTDDLGLWLTISE